MLFRSVYEIYLIGQNEYKLYTDINDLKTEIENQISILRQVRCSQMYVLVKSLDDQYSSWFTYKEIENFIPTV